MLKDPRIIVIAGVPQQAADCSKCGKTVWLTPDADAAKCKCPYCVIDGRRGSDDIRH